MPLKVQLSSRFDLLKVEDGYDSEEEEISDKEQPIKVDPKPAAVGKKKSKQTKKQDNQKIGGHGETKQSHVPGQNEIFSDSHWADLEKRNEEYVEGEFKRELNETLIHSRLQYEEMKQKTEAGAVCQPSIPQSKKKKEKSVTMTLDQFSQAYCNNRLPKGNKSKAELNAESSISSSKQEMDFFDEIEEDAAKILSRERQRHKHKPPNTTIIISQSKGAHAEETPEIKKQKKDLEIKDKEIVMLLATRKKLEDELQQVKKRNAQLLHMLGQGEMKEKTPFFLEIEDLKQICEELTNELAQRKSELEEERSNVLLLKTEVDKLKGIKHSGK